MELIERNEIVPDTAYPNRLIGNNSVAAVWEV
jgi:hypothetical protein